MSEYTRYDFSETLARVQLSANPKRVLAAWGQNGDYGEWSGGFFLELEDDSRVYIQGCCDTTGWGCQDGVDIHSITVDFEVWLKATPGWSNRPDLKDWDKYPMDLNKWLHEGMKSDDRW